GNFNLKKCEYLFRENLACRAIYDIDSFADHGRIPEVVEKYGFVSPFGFAKDGTPLLYVAMGRGDLYGFVASICSYEICWYGSTCFETDLKRARMEGKKWEKPTLIKLCMINFLEEVVKDNEHIIESL
ncbi:hypothetical protein TNIN_266901, partial [Trichonephila inaurata madagascariensis]